MTARRFIVSALSALMVFFSFSVAGAQQTRATSARITVENRRDVPVVAYLERGPFDLRLGTVPKQDTKTFPLPPDLNDGQIIQVFVHPEGDVDLAPEDITVRDGEDVNVLVPADRSGDIPGPQAEVLPDPSEGMTTVAVENDMAREVTLFAEEGDFDLRLGTVPPHAERVLIIPDQLAEQQESVELVAHPEGGVDFPTRTFQVYPGAHLRMKVPPVG